jgi:hypothetical protein
MLSGMYTLIIIYFISENMLAISYIRQRYEVFTKKFLTQRLIPICASEIGCMIRPTRRDAFLLLRGQLPSYLVRHKVCAFVHRTSHLSN